MARCPSRQALLTREQFYTQYSKNLVERDTYRKQIRELGERCDEMQLQLFQKESQLLATEAKLKRLQLELPTPVRLRGCRPWGGLGSCAGPERGRSEAFAPKRFGFGARSVGNHPHANTEFRKMNNVTDSVTSPWFQARISGTDTC